MLIVQPVQSQTIIGGGPGATAIVWAAVGGAGTAVVVKPAQSPTQILFYDANGNLLANNVLAVKTGETGTRWLKLAGYDGNPENLSGATGLQLTIARWNGVPFVSGRTLAVTDVVNGIVSFQQQAGDLPVPGVFNLEVQITRADGSIGQFPELGYALVEVTKSLTQ